MIYSIENNYLTVQIDSLGAELMSIKSTEGIEYLWQGNPEFWKGRAYNLFPICGRIWEGKFNYDGKTYEGMKNPHGFIRVSKAADVKVNKSDITFIFKSDENTLKFYPFEFEYSIKYQLEDKKINMIINVINNDTKLMYFAVGGHPGFNVPLKQGNFEDYYLFFEDAKELKQVVFSDTCFTTEKEVDFKLRCKKLNLKHDLFDNDAIALKGAKKSITLKSKLDDKSVKVIFPEEMKYVAIWHSPKAEAPFVAIEPWTCLPAYDGKVDDLETKKDMFTLKPNAKFDLTWSIEIN